MSKRLQELKESNSPLVQDENVLSIDADIDRYAAIAAFNSSQGGKELRKALRSDIVAAINELTRGYAKLSHSELQAIGAKVDARVSLLQAMGNAKQNQQDAEKTLDELTS
jgi:hypothetical protein